MRRIGMIVAAACLAAAGAATAQEGTIRIELNKLEMRGEACRAYLVFVNGTPQQFDRFKLDLVMFDKDGVIVDRIAADAGPIRPRKTSVKLFDLQRLSCSQLARILLNDVIDCGSGSSERTDCIRLVETASRTSVSLVK